MSLVDRLVLGLGGLRPDGWTTGEKCVVLGAVERDSGLNRKEYWMDNHRKA